MSQKTQKLIDGVAWIAILGGLLVVVPALVRKALRPSPDKYVEKLEPYAKLTADPPDANGRFPNTHCTAFVVSDNYALTAAHCVSMNILGLEIPMDPLILVDSSGKGRLVSVVMPRHGRIDLAAVQGDFSMFKHFKIDDQELGISPSDNLETCGFPWGNPTYKCFPISAHAGASNLDGLFLYKLSGFMAPHMSGGPVINTSTGKVVGINVAVDYNNIFMSAIIGASAILGLESW